MTKPATEDAEGEMTYTCPVCSEVKKEIIPKLQSKSISIGTLEELIAFAKSVDEGESYKDCTVTLTSDIDASDIEWEPIGSYVKASEYKAFAGTFDGSGHTVKINATGSVSSGVGFIAVNEGTVKNLIIEGSVSGKSYVGAVVGYNLGNISDCVSKASVSAVSMSVS